MNRTSSATTLGLTPASAVIVDFLAVKQVLDGAPVRWAEFRFELSPEARTTLSDVGWSEAMISLRQRDLVEDATDADGLAVFSLTEQGRRELGLRPLDSLTDPKRPLRIGARQRRSPLAERACA